MSYLVDALRKAERERHAHQDSDLYAASTGTSYAATGSRAGPWLWLVAILVASNVALAVYVWRPRASQPAPVPMVSQAQVAAPSKPDVATAERAAPAAHESRSPTGQSGRVSQSALAAAARGHDREVSRIVDRATAQRAPLAGTAPSRASPDSGGASNGGSVTYSKTPLTDDASTATTAASGRNAASVDDLPDQGGVGGVPSVTINGQLYSTVPGRSFILVGGRRYHEGERLAAGPAVESIGPNGATLLYKGERYHVAGPG